MYYFFPASNPRTDDVDENWGGITGELQNGIFGPRGGRGGKERNRFVDGGGLKRAK